jgi:hypothetical protein
MKLGIFSDRSKMTGQESIQKLRNDALYKIIIIIIIK